MKSAKRIAVQGDGTAYYAEIEFEITDGSWGFLLPKNIDVVPRIWHPGIMFSLSLIRAWTKPESRLDNIGLSVSSFQGQVVDTKLMAVAYVTFHAIAQELEPGLLDRFKFDRENWQFVIG